MVKTVIIMQGLPGSGKSRWAGGEAVRRHDADLGLTCIISADDYFTKDGEYRFDAAQLGRAHATCMERFVRLLDQGCVSTVIVDNTNITTDQMSPYYLVAKAFNAEVQVVQMYCTPDTAMRRTTHGVPPATIKRMWFQWQHPPAYWETNKTIVVMTDWQLISAGKLKGAP